MQIKYFVFYKVAIKSFVIELNAKNGNLSVKDGRTYGHIEIQKQLCCLKLCNLFPFVRGGCLRFGSGDDVGYEEKGEDDDKDGVAHDLTINSLFSPLHYQFIIMT